MHTYRVVLSGEGYDFPVEVKAINEYECRERVRKDYPGFYIESLVEQINV
tara:strand:+ start:257 stop:406 length:150 start_codon:yes stop_codon:yes gene_type:complete